MIKELGEFKISLKQITRVRFEQSPFCKTIITHDILNK